MIAGAAAVAFLGWFASLKVNTKTAAVGYDFVLPFEERTVEKYISANGKIVMSDIVSVSTDVTQKVKTINYKIGDFVNEGDILCEFESEQLDEQIERLERLIADKKAVDALENTSSAGNDEYLRKSHQLGIQSAFLAMEAAKKSYDTAYAKYDEYYQKYYNCTDGAESELYYNMYNQYGAELENLKKQYENAQKTYNSTVDAANKASEAKESADYIKSFNISDLDEYEKSLSKLKTERENLIVKAPKSGIISECFITEGSYAFDSSLFRLGTLGDYKIEAFVNGRDILDVVPGMEASFRTTLTDDADIKGKVTKVSDIFNGMGYSVELEITDKSAMEKLRPNVNAAIKLYIIDLGEVKAVPYDAVVIDDDGESFVFRAVKKGSEYIAEKVRVETGFESDYYVEVVSSDLADGDLVLSGKKYNDGDRLKLKGMAE